MVLQVALTDFSGEELAAPPPTILGMWVTDDPRYEGRAFELFEEELEPHLGDGMISRHAIQSMRGVLVGSSWSYEMICSSVDGDMSFDFLVHPGGILQLKNPREVVWRQPQG